MISPAGTIIHTTRGDSQLARPAPRQRRCGSPPFPRAGALRPEDRSPPRGARRDSRSAMLAPICPSPIIPILCFILSFDFLDACWPLPARPLAWRGGRRPLDATASHPSGRQDQPGALKPGWRSSGCPKRVRRCDPPSMAVVPARYGEGPHARRRHLRIHRRACLMIGVKRGRLYALAALWMASAWVDRHGSHRPACAGRCRRRWLGSFR